ncbi:hypothetical protein GCM10028857_05450 [Salinarchaeum chitinilyticum]
MAETLDGPRTTIRDARREVGFGTAVIVGTIVVVLIALLQSDLTGATRSYEFGSATIVGGAITGAVYGAPRQTAAKAGALAGGLPLLVLGTAFYALGIVPGTVGASTGLSSIAVPLFFLPFFFLVFALLNAFAAAFGGVSAYVAHWLVEAVLESNRSETRPTVESLRG